MKDKGIEFDSTDMCRIRMCPTAVREFEKVLYERLEFHLPMTFQTVTRLAQHLQCSELFKDDRPVQSMRFSHVWWEKYQRRFGIRYKGNQMYHPVEQVVRHPKPDETDDDDDFTDIMTVKVEADFE